MSCVDQLQELLERSTKKHEIPGASLAVWYDDRLHEAATGVLNTSTGVEATRDSVFQIGSITKLFTATLCMQLVEQGKLELDRPIYEYIPSFGLADMNAARQVTLRHLLSHSSGMAGDIFMETGDGPERFLRLIDRDERVQRAELRPGDRDHLGRGVQLHRAGAERDHQIGRAHV